MMKYRFFISVFVLLMVFCSTVHAQAWPTADVYVARIQDELNMEPEQLEKVRVIINEIAKKRLEISSQLPLGLTQAQAQGFYMETYHRLSTVLTVEQMKQWEPLHELLLKETEFGAGE